MDNNDSLKELCTMFSRKVCSVESVTIGRESRMIETTIK